MFRSAPQLACTISAAAAFVFHDAIKPEEADGGGVGMHFDLDVACLASGERGTMGEAAEFQFAAEGRDVRSGGNRD